MVYYETKPPEPKHTVGQLALIGGRGARLLHVRKVRMLAGLEIRVHGEI